MNVQRKIIEGIKDVLHAQDYVILPEFGGFVTQIHFSKYLVEKNILTPPGKLISFNKQLRQNDGVLTFWLQGQLGITQEVAFNHIKEFSDYCKQILEAKRRLTLDELGFFYLDLENNICFEPKTDTNYLLDSFGLSSVILNELQEEPIVEEKKKLIEFVDRTVDVKENPPAKKRNLKPLAYFSLAGSILFFSLATLVNLNKNNGPLFSGVFSSNTITTYKPIQYPDLTIQNSALEVKPYIANSNGIAVIAINDKTLAVAVTETPPELEAKSISTNKKSTVLINGKYQIVLGCFSLKNNAEKMVKKLKRKEIKAAITGTNNKGLHVVSCAGFNTKDEAQNYLSNIKSNFPTAWIMSE